MPVYTLGELGLALVGGIAVGMLFERWSEMLRDRHEAEQDAADDGAEE